MTSKMVALVLLSPYITPWRLEANFRHGKTNEDVGLHGKKKKKRCRNIFFAWQFLFSRVRLVRQCIRYLRVELERTFLVHGAAASMWPSFPPPSLPVQDECVELSPLRVSGHETTALSGMGATGGSGGGRTSFVSERLRLPLCCLGVFVCYFWYGVLQETITRGKYGEGAKQEKFRYALSLVFIQCVINAIFAKLMIQFFDAVKVDRTRNWLYAACSLSYLGAMVSSNSALQFVNYPTQVLGKSCKPIPVMLLGVTVLRKKYPLSKYFCVLLIVTGVALFMYKPKNVGSVGDEHVFGYGELLLLLSLTLDGLTGVSQDHMRAHYQTGSNHMMLNVNLCSTLFLGADFHFHDCGLFWASDLLYCHHNSQVLHHFGFSHYICQSYQ
ncbi:solute carrier family 35 member B1 isoform 2-T2 [Vipera latastei]